MKNFTKSRLMIFAFVLLALSLSACNAQTQEAEMNPTEAPVLATESLVPPTPLPPTPIPPTATLPPPQFPTGKFISVSDPNYVYRFEKDNTWSYYIGGLMGAKGTFQVEGDQWIEQGTPECPFTGTYQWSFDGEMLTFSLVGQDDCSPRKDATDGQKFTMAP